MERKKHSDMSRKRNKKRFASRALALFLTVVLVLNVNTIPADAFSLGGLFKKVSNVVKSIQKIVDTSDNKTVYSFSELNSFTSSLFAPTNIKIKLGADIYVPSNRNITSVLHNVDLNLNGHTIYCNNSGQAFFISYGREFKIYDGKVVQRVNNSNGIIYMSGGDAEITNVTFKKSGSASRVTGVYITGILANPKITFNNVTFDGMTTGLNIQYGGNVVMNNSYIKNSQGDAVNIYGQYNDKKSTLTMTGGYIKYFKGNGINAGSGAKVDLTNVTITGGTTRNRYGILAGIGSDVNLNGNCKVYSSAGGNIGVYKENPNPVKIASLTSDNKYSFTVLDGLNGTNPAAVAKLTTAFSGDIRSLPAYSDISRYMVRGNENKNEILIQNPPAQCDVTAELLWSGKALNTTKDANYATLSVNGGTESTSGNAVVKYDAKVTLSTTNNDPERYQFLGWEKYVGNVSQGIVSTSPTYQVEVIDAEVTYKAKYEYKKYTITVKSSGKGTVTGTGTYYVDDTVTLTATPATVSGKTYAFIKWNDGNTEKNRTITVSKDETYTGMFKKTGQTTGTMYLGVKEITSINELKKSGDKLLLVYVGSVDSSQNNKLEASSGNVGTTGLPDYSAMLSSTGTSNTHGRTKAESLTTTGSYAYFDGYGYGVDPSGDTLLSVHVDQKGRGFDGCQNGFIGYYTYRGETSWLYWCDGGGVKAVGPFALYSYSEAKTFNMSDVKIEMPSDFTPSVSGDIIDKSRLAVYVNVNGTRYDLGGLKFVADDLDNKINYAEGDKLINFELDGVAVDYSYPEATIDGKQYTKLSDAIAAATNSRGEETIHIVGPGVDMIDISSPVTLAEGDKIEGYDKETVTAKEGSEIGVDKDGTVRLTKGTLELEPSGNTPAAVGVKNAFTKTDKKITVVAEEGKEPVIVPEGAGTTLQISPDNNPEHIAIISGAGGDGRTYEFDNIPSYAGEKVEIAKETEYTVNIPGSEAASGTAIKTSKYNTGDTTIEGGTDNGNPVITSTNEGDKITVGDNTYVTGKNEEGKKIKYQVNPDQTAVPSVVLESGELGIPVDTTIKVNNTIIKNTGATSGGDVTSANPVQISASGDIEIPDGAGVTIDGVQIEVPAKTPMNGSTTVTLDNGKPVITTTGDSEVKLVVDGKETTYKVGDYDCVMTIGDDGIPVIEDGEIRLQPGQTIKDRLGNEYRCPEDATEGITIMTTPLVYETDDNGNPILGEDGKPVLVGGGDMSFLIPEGKGIECKPSGSKDYTRFENPGSDSGFFNLDPARAADGIEADSELGLAPGKELNLSAGDKSITVQAPASGNSGDIMVDGSTGSVTLTKTGDTVIIGGKTYTAKEDNTVFIVNEDGVTLSSGGASSEKGAAINAEGLVITGVSGSASVETSAETGNTTIQTTGKTEFSIAPVGKDTEKINLVTGDGSNEYPVGIDGSVTLPARKTITRKRGESEVKIEADSSDVTLKPMPKPGKEETAAGDGEVTPVGGLLIEVPTGSAVKIGGKTYKESTIDSGRDENYSLPMQLVLDEKGAVVLYNGTVELGKDADISLYDVANELATFKNTSKNDKKVQITNPGIATMPSSGASITMGAGKNTVEFTTTEDNTQIAYTSEICLLKRGGVSLDPKEQILVGDMIVKNTSTEKKIEVTRNEELKQDETEFTYTGTIKVPNGGSFELSSPGSDNAIVYQSNVEGGEGTSEFTINEDGNLVLPQGGIAKLKNGSKEVTVQAGVENVESVPTQEGAVFAIPEGGHIVVDNVKYTNNDTEGHLVLAVNQDGKVVLVQGKVELSEGAIVYVKNEDDGLVPIKNNAQTGEEAEQKTISVSYDGVQEGLDENDQVECTTYAAVNIDVPTGGSISIGENTYDTVGTDGAAKITMDIEKVDGSAVTDGNIPGDRILLEEGTVKLGQDSTITIDTSDDESADSKKVLTNISEDAETQIQVGSDGKVELPNGSGVCVDNDTTIQVPDAEGTDSYKVAVYLVDTDGKVDIKLQTENGQGTSGADKKVIINDGTYISNEEDNDLGLTLDTDKAEVSLSDGSNSVGLSSGAAIVVGDTTVTATTEKEITVTETGSGLSKVPKVDVPAGGEANIKNTDKDKDIDIKVPEKSSDSSETDNQEFTVDTDGNVSTNLKKDETVVIGGVEYTGTSDSDEENKIKVDGENGNLLEGPTGDSSPTVSIDPKQFSKENYQFTLGAGKSVTVNGVEYQAPEGSSVTLLGNPNGNPIVKLDGENSSVIIGGKTYTAGNGGAQFVLDNAGNITLKSGSLKLSGKETKNVNGVVYCGSTDGDSYTVSYGGDGCHISIADGSKLRVDMPAGKKIYMDGKGAINDKDENGKDVTETFGGPIPITMNGGRGSIYLDKTKDEQTDTAFVQILGTKNVSIQRAGDAISAITISQKSTSSSGSQIGAGGGVAGGEDDQKTASIPVKGDTGEVDTQIAVVIEADKIFVDTITTDVADKLVSTTADGTKVASLDCSSLEKSTVVLDVPTVENMTEKADKIKIITVSAEIEIDKKATDAMLGQASGDTIEIVFKQEKQQILNTAQKKTLKKYEVKSCMDAFVVSNGTRISDFKGGKIKVSIPWDVEAGNKALYYHVYQLKEDGKMKEYETVYSDGELCFETEQFSSKYIVTYDDKFLNATPVDQTPVLASAAKVKKTSVKLKWEPVDGAKKYVIYNAVGKPNSKKYKLKKVATIDGSKSSYVLNKLKAGTDYKIVVKALGEKEIINESLTLNVATNGGKSKNATGISVRQKSVALKAGNTKTLKVNYNSGAKKSKLTDNVRFVSSNKEVATVSKSGKIKTKRVGTCYVYAILNSGEYTAVKVTVK